MVATDGMEQLEQRLIFLTSSVAINPEINKIKATKFNCLQIYYVGAFWCEFVNPYPKGIPFLLSDKVVILKISFAFKFAYQIS